MANDKPFPAMRETTRHKGPIQQGYSYKTVEAILNGLGYHIVNGENEDINFIDPATGIRHSFVPAAGFKIEVVDASIVQPSVMPRPAYDKTITITKVTEHYQYTDRFLKVRYELPPAGSFQSDEIYVVYWATLREILAAYATAGQPLPAAFAVPIGPICDSTGGIRGFETTEVYWPPQLQQVVETIEATARQEVLFEA